MINRQFNAMANAKAATEPKGETRMKGKKKANSQLTLEGEQLIASKKDE